MSAIKTSGDAVPAAVLAEKGIAGVRGDLFAVVVVLAGAGKDVIGFRFPMVLVESEGFAGENGNFRVQAEFVIHLLLIQQTVDGDGFLCHD